MNKIQVQEQTNFIKTFVLWSNYLKLKIFISAILITQLIGDNH